LFDEFDGFGGEPRGFAVFFADIGGFVGVLHEPARGEVGAVGAGVGKVVPRVFGLVAFGFEVFVIGAAFLVVKAFGAFGPEAVVAHPDVKAAFGLAGADEAVGFQSEAGHAFGVGDHMGFADEPAVHADAAEVVGHGLLTDAEGKAVELRAMG